MGRHRTAFVALPIYLSFALSGCGFAVPQINEIWDEDRPEDKANSIPLLTGTAQMEILIKTHVFCELKNAVRKTLEFPIPFYDGPTGKLLGTKPLIPPGWSVQVALMLQVDESTALNGGLTLIDVLPNAINKFPQGNVTTGQSRSFGFGTTASTTATRIDKFNFNYTVADLMIMSKDSICRHPDNKLLASFNARSSPLIESDLGIEKWLLGALMADAVLYSSEPPPAKAPKGSPAGAPAGGKSGGAQSNVTDAISEEIKFIIISSGSATPTWKLVRLTANTSNNLLALGRTRTHDLIITLGPNTPSNSFAHLASQIGAAINSRSGN
jgi:hypothetical protein